jgi:hypothetical protein
MPTFNTKEGVELRDFVLDVANFATMDMKCQCDVLSGCPCSFLLHWFLVLLITSKNARTLPLEKKINFYINDQDHLKCYPNIDQLW